MHGKWDPETLTLIIDEWKPIDHFPYDYWDGLMFVGARYGLESTTECFYKGDTSPSYNMADKIQIVFKNKPGAKVLKQIVDDVKIYLEGSAPKVD